VFVVAINRSGNENGRRHIGKSMIVNPVGASVVALAGVDDPQLLVQELDLDDVATAQKSLPWWRDRRPDLYKHLVCRLLLEKKKTPTTFRTVTSPQPTAAAPSLTHAATAAVSHPTT